MSRPVRSVAIVGRDAAAWLTAHALARTLTRTGISVHVVELPSLLSPIDVFAALPTLESLHALLGIDEAKILAACAGTPVFAQRFANWSKNGQPFLHAYDTTGVAIENVEFLHYWVKARAEGMNVAFEDFCLGAAAAKQGRVVAASDATEAYSKAAHGYHLSARDYVRAIRQRALGHGATHQRAVIREVRRQGDRIQSVILGDEQVLEADFFIDASGVEAALIGAAPGAAFEPWTHWFGADRMMTASAKRLEPLPSFSQIAAFKDGWIGLHPLQDRTGICAVYDSRQAPDHEIVRTLPVLTGLALEGDAIASDIRPGLRRNAWVGNCAAVGEAALALDPLDAAPLHVVQIGLSLLVSLFPVDAEIMAEAPLYNRAMAEHGTNLRDFQLAHYKLNQRWDEPFWDRARAAEPPPTLAYKLDLFAKRGRMAQYDNETFQEWNWTASFLGHGLIPAAYDPLADRMPQPELIRTFQEMLAFVAKEVREMPSLEAYLEMHTPLGGR